MKYLEDKDRISNTTHENEQSIVVKQLRRDMRIMSYFILTMLFLAFLVTIFIAAHRECDCLERLNGKAGIHKTDNVNFLAFMTLVSQFFDLFSVFVSLKTTLDNFN